MPSRNSRHPDSRMGRHPDGQRPEGSQNFSKVIKEMLASAGVHSFDISIVFLTGRQMRALNRKALGHDYVTDVITFDLKGIRGIRGHTPNSCVSMREFGVCPRIPEGEIYICPAEARRNARLYGEPFERELLRYIAHGILHLLGHDDRTLKQREAMRKAEDRLLGNSGTYTKFLCSRA